jgi:hypothetical protein
MKDNNNNNDWFSTPKIASNNGDNDYDYCSYCLTSFHKYNPTINNICQVCGRVNTKVMQDKQPSQQLTAVNTHMTESDQQSTMRAVSMQIRYSRLLSQDETKTGLHSSGNTRASFNSFKEAQNYLNQISDMSNATLNARQKKKYHVTTTTSKARTNSISLTVNQETNPLSFYETTNSAAVEQSELDYNDRRGENDDYYI